MHVRFWKFSTAGNTTLFVDDRDALLQTLELISAEQAGYVCGTSLAMAGGELCINACLAFACLLRLQRNSASQLCCCGYEIRIEAAGELPEWQCRASFPLCNFKSESRGKIRLQHLDGISHALIECASFPSSAKALATAAILRSELGLDARPAAGIVWWRRAGESLEIMPVVSVPAAGTCNAEAACGSGSIALALSMPKGSYAIVQPSGATLHVQTFLDSIQVKAPVRLLAQGVAWH